eukprot:jgi/Psemu1/303146/fgenesh1_kg.94_\
MNSFLHPLRCPSYSAASSISPLGPYDIVRHELNDSIRFLRFGSVWDQATRNIPFWERLGLRKYTYTY